MIFSDELFSEALDGRPVLARLFLLAYYLGGSNRTENEKNSFLEYDMNVFSILPILEKDANYKADKNILYSDNRNRIEMYDGHVIAEKAFKMLPSYAKDDVLFFEPIENNTCIVSCLMGILHTLILSEDNENKSKPCSYSRFLKETRSIDDVQSRLEECKVRFANNKEMLLSEKANAENKLRKLKQEGHPYATNEAEYFRYLKNNVTPMNIRGAYIALVKIFDIFIPAPFDLDFLKKGHTYIVGRSGSGKSELIRTLCRRLTYNFVLLDPHGDLSHDLINSGYNIAPPLFAPHEKRAVINPFDIDDKSPENRELVAQEITDLMAELVEDSGLSRLMTTIIFPIVYTLLKLPYADFKMLSDCINPNSGKARLKSISHLVEPHHKAIWQELESDTYDTSKQSVFNRLQSLLNYRLVMQTLCGKDDFSRAIEPRLHEGKGVIVSLPIPIIGEAVAVTIGRFFMTRMQIWAKRRQSIPEHEREPVVFFVDEFHNFVSQATAKTLDQYGRKFKLYMVLAHQHIQQITDREIRGSVLANTINKIAGMSNTETRQAVSREMAIEADQLESLSPGYFWGRFGSSQAVQFYARRARKDKSIKTPFIESVNGDEFIDGWDGFDQEQDGQEDTRPKPATRKGYKAKFDI